MLRYIMCMSFMYEQYECIICMFSMILPSYMYVLYLYVLYVCLQKLSWILLRGYSRLPGAKINEKRRLVNLKVIYLEMAFGACFDSGFRIYAIPACQNQVKQQIINSNAVHCGTSSCDHFDCRNQPRHIQVPGCHILCSRSRLGPRVLVVLTEQLCMLLPDHAPRGSADIYIYR